MEEKERALPALKKLQDCRWMEVRRSGGAFPKPDEANGRRRDGADVWRQRKGSLVGPACFSLEVPPGRPSEAN